MTSAPIGGSVFHSLLRDCLALDRLPTQQEIELVARKIWQDGFASITNMDWQDLRPDSEAYSRTVRAAQIALGAHRP